MHSIRTEKVQKGWDWHTSCRTQALVKFLEGVSISTGGYHIGLASDKSQGVPGMPRQPRKLRKAHHFVTEAMGLGYGVAFTGPRPDRELGVSWRSRVVQCHAKA